MSNINEIEAVLKENPKIWLITRVAGFSESNLPETLLKLGQIVVGLDNFSIGKEKNFQDAKNAVDPYN
jgi:UDP-N-acetylglucosamine 4-epimerase